MRLPGLLFAAFLGLAPSACAPASTETVVQAWRRPFGRSHAVAPAANRPGLVGYTPLATPTFADVPTDFCCYKFVGYVAQPSVAVGQGYANELYHPELDCTRDQMAVCVAHTFKLPFWPSRPKRGGAGR